VGLAEIKKATNDLTHELKGNSQPGILAQHESRLKELETNKSITHGKMAVIAFLAALLASIAVNVLTGLAVDRIHARQQVTVSAPAQAAQPAPARTTP